MKRLLVVFLLAIPTVFASLSAQDEVLMPQKNEFGAHAGSTTGIGLSYRHWYNRTGFQITAIPIKTDEFFMGSVGLSGLYSLKKMKYVHVYMYLGTHLFATDEYVSYYDDMGYWTHDEKSRENRFMVGFGPGFSFGRVVAFNLQVGYGIYDMFDSFNLFPAGEIGVYYMF